MAILYFSLVTLKIVLYNNFEDQYENHSLACSVCVCLLRSALATQRLMSLEFIYQLLSNYLNPLPN